MPPKKQKRAVVKTWLRRKHVLATYGGILFLTWAVLYLPHLRTSPRWYGDETVTIACGQDLVHGIFANRGSWNTYVNPQFCYQPGYVALIGAASEWSGRNIFWPRFLNTLCALLIAGTTLLVIGRRYTLTFGFLAALTFLAYLQTVIHFRWVYSHNAVAAGFFLTFSLFAIRESRRRNWLAGWGLAIAAASHPLALQGGIAAGLIRITKPRSWIPIFLPPLIVGVLCILPSFIRWPSWFVEDIHNLATFYKSYSDQNGSGWQSVINFYTFFTHDAFHILATLSLIFALFTRLRPLAIAAFILAYFLTANRQNLPVFYYQAIIILPLLTCCLAYAVWRLRKFANPRLKWLRWAPFLLPAVLLYQSVPPAVQGTLVSRNDTWVTQSIPDLTETVKWVNEHTTPQDLVIAHWNTGWLLKARTADLFQATSYLGWSTHTFEHMPPKERFRYNLSPSRVKYLIVGDIDMRWTFGGTNIREWLTAANVEQWPIVFRTPTYLVLQNPATP